MNTTMLFGATDDRLTGMPEEHEIPAPVTTTIFLHLATKCEMFVRERRVEVSDESRSRVTVMVAGTCRVESTCGERGRWGSRRTGQSEGEEGP